MESETRYIYVSSSPVHNDVDRVFIKRRRPIIKKVYYLGDSILITLVRAQALTRFSCSKKNGSLRLLQSANGEEEEEDTLAP